MAKKLLCVIVLMVALVCVLASCGHEHSWGEWQTTKEATCTAEGSRIRNCTDEKCDESEIETIYAKGHSFGEWVTTKKKTCTTDGSKERVCSCGKKETETIYCTGHTNPSAWGCYDCKEGWVTINLPETPLTVWFSDLNAFKITELSYALGRNDSSNTYTFQLIYSGEKVIDNSTRPSQTKRCQFEIKLVDSEGYVIFTETVITDSLDVGDKLKDSKVTKYNLNLDPNKTYTLIISDT